MTSAIRPGLFVIVAGFGAAAAPGYAVEYAQVDAAQSRLAFGYRQMGVAMDGRFKRFVSQVSFDPAKPAAAKAAIDVELASVDLGSSDADSEVAGKPWFNTRSFPSARFVSSSVKPLGGNRYEIAGKLSIKGRTLDITAPVTYTPQGRQGVFEGSFGFNRSDFAIGEGSWSAVDVVANEILVRFRITALPGK